MDLYFVPNAWRQFAKNISYLEEDKSPHSKYDVKGGSKEREQKRSGEIDMLKIPFLPNQVTLEENPSTILLLASHAKVTCWWFGSVFHDQWKYLRRKPVLHLKVCVYKRRNTRQNAFLFVDKKKI